MTYAFDDTTMIPVIETQEEAAKVFDKLPNDVKCMLWPQNYMMNEEN